MFSNTFAGLAPVSVPTFVLAQLAIRALYPDVTLGEAAELVVPHHETAVGQPAIGGWIATALFVCPHNAGHSQKS